MVTSFDIEARPDSLFPSYTAEKSLYLMTLMIYMISLTPLRLWKRIYLVKGKMERVRKGSVVFL
jgi:hypothetical protein